MNFSSPITTCVVAKAPEAQDTYICNEQTHYWNNQIIWKVAHFKDVMINYAKQNGFDYIFLVDSDIVLTPGHY